jgi:hypothetical protein
MKLTPKTTIRFLYKQQIKSVLDDLNRGIDEEAHVRVQKMISIEDDVEGLLEHLVRSKAADLMHCFTSTL